MKLTSFQRDLLAVITDGACYLGLMQSALMVRGRKRVQMVRVCRAFESLRKDGRIVTSMDARTTIATFGQRSAVRQSIAGGAP